MSSSASESSRQELHEEPPLSLSHSSVSEVHEEDDELRRGFDWNQDEEKSRALEGRRLGPFSALKCF
jgi:hypothetical protein